MITITEKKYSEWARNFVAGIRRVDYLIRNLTVGDGEQERPIKELEANIAYGPSQLAVWFRDWQLVPTQIVARVFELLQLAIGARYLTEEETREICTLLLPFLSNRQLFEQHISLWETIYFTAHEGQSYKQFKQEHQHCWKGEVKWS